jgi:hypothetical protein
MAREQTGAARELQHVTGRLEGIDRSLERRCLLEPAGIALGSQVVWSSAEPNVVVLRCAILVVAGLLCEDALDRIGNPDPPTFNVRSPHVYRQDTPWRGAYVRGVALPTRNSLPVERTTASHPRSSSIAVSSSGSKKRFTIVN